MNQSQEPQNVLNRLEDFYWTPKSVLAVVVFTLVSIHVFATFENLNPWLGIPLFLLFCAPDLVLLLGAAVLWGCEKVTQAWRERRRA